MSLLTQIAAHLQVGAGDVARFLRAAPARYKIYRIPKRNGDFRTIAQPSATLKIMQRFVLDSRLSKAHVHSAAAAYVKGIGIADNARRHQASSYILKLDFAAFFPSIGVSDWRKFARKNRDLLPEEDDDTIERILFWGAGSFSPAVLSIGAPSSPYVSNVLMFDFDEAVSRIAEQASLTYSRYADDITVSGASRRDITIAEREIRRLVAVQRSPRLQLNEAKRGLYGPGERRMVTGLILKPEGGVSLGRDRKRQISAMIHRASKGELDALELAKLKGLFGFVIANEADFLNRMRAKYGDAVVDRVLRFELPVDRK